MLLREMPQRGISTFMLSFILVSISSKRFYKLCSLYTFYLKCLKYILVLQFIALRLIAFLLCIIKTTRVLNLVTYCWCHHLINEINRGNSRNFLLKDAQIHFLSGHRMGNTLEYRFCSFRQFIKKIFTTPPPFKFF